MDNSSINQAIGKRIKQARELKGLSQQQLAEILELGQSQVSHVEAGKTTANPTILRKISKQLGVTYEFLLDGASDAMGSPSIVDFKFLPFVLIPSKAGFIEHFDVGTEVEMRPFYVPFKMPDVDIVFEAHGDSMYPIIKSGALLFCKKVEQPDSIISNFRTPYVVLFGSNLSVKYLENKMKGEGKLVMHSENKEMYPPHEIEAEEVRAIWRVMASYDEVVY
jgi:transcriptional regulator with XRE-family HTH domain